MLSYCRSSVAVENSSAHSSLSSLLASHELISTIFGGDSDFRFAGDLLSRFGDLFSLFGIFSPTRVSTFSISLRISSQSDSVLV
jgi:hypothetical protein